MIFSCNKYQSIDHKNKSKHKLIFYICTRRYIQSNRSKQICTQFVNSWYLKIRLWRHNKVTQQQSFSSILWTQLHFLYTKLHPRRSIILLSTMTEQYLTNTIMTMNKLNIMSGYISIKMNKHTKLKQRHFYNMINSCCHRQRSIIHSRRSIVKYARLIKLFRSKLKCVVRLYSWIWFLWKQHIPHARFLKHKLTLNSCGWYHMIKTK